MPFKYDPDILNELIMDRFQGFTQVPMFVLVDISFPTSDFMYQVGVIYICTYPYKSAEGMYNIQRGDTFRSSQMVARAAQTFGYWLRTWVDRYHPNRVPNARPRGGGGGGHSHICPVQVCATIKTRFLLDLTRV